MVFLLLTISENLGSYTVHINSSLRIPEMDFPYLHANPKTGITRKCARVDAGSLGIEATVACSAAH